MNEQSLALLPPPGSTHWMQREPLSERMLADIAEVNTVFVALALELHLLRPGMPVLGLPAHLLPGLARQGRIGIGSLRLPYVLFDLRFRDAGYWRDQLTGVVSVQDSEGTRATDVRLVRFARTALTLAWHLAQSDPRAARLAFGLETATESLLVGLSVGALDSLARRMAPALAARFCTRERFWSMLGDAARTGTDPACIERVRLLGLQLQGADAARAQQLYRRQRRSTQA
jgi:hypothetical protein